MPFGRQMEYHRQVEDFKSRAKSHHFSAKGKSTAAGFQEFKKLYKPVEWFYVDRDGPGYHDDSTQIWYVDNQAGNPSRARAKSYDEVESAEARAQRLADKIGEPVEVHVRRHSPEGRGDKYYWAYHTTKYPKSWYPQGRATNPAVSLAAIDKALRKAGKTVQVKLTGAAAATIKKAMSLTPAGRRKARSEAIVRRVMGNPRQTNGRSYVRRGVPAPPSHRYKAGDVVYLDGRKAVIRRVGVSDGVDYVWFVRPVDGTLAMSERNLRQASYIDEGSL